MSSDTFASSISAVETPGATRRPLAIVSALPEEQGGLIEQLQGAVCVQHAGRDFWLGTLRGHAVVLALSRIGKVAAATTAAALVEKFGIGSLVFTGVAGGVGPGVQVGDVVVGNAYLQHDMDASPLFKPYEVPLTGKAVFPADGGLVAALEQATAMALAELPLPASGRRPRKHTGLIASGDRFVSGAAELAQRVGAMQQHGYFPLAVEMEGAAVAQVCADYGIPFAAVRTISDRADDSAHVDFPAFVKEVASVYAQRIIGALLTSTNPACGSTT